MCDCVFDADSSLVGERGNGLEVPCPDCGSENTNMTITREDVEAYKADVARQEMEERL